MSYINYRNGKTQNNSHRYDPKIERQTEGKKLVYAEKRKLFVGGVPHGCVDAEFNDAFRSFGQIEDITLMRDRESGRGRGFGFITMVRKEDALRILRAEITIKGRHLDIKVAQPPNSRNSNTSPRAKLNRQMGDYDKFKGGQAPNYDPFWQHGTTKWESQSYAEGRDDKGGNVYEGYQNYRKPTQQYSHGGDVLPRNGQEYGGRERESNRTLPWSKDRAYNGGRKQEGNKSALGVRQKYPVSTQYCDRNQQYASSMTSAEGYSQLSRTDNDNISNPMGYDPQNDTSYKKYGALRGSDMQAPNFSENLNQGFGYESYTGASRRYYNPN